MHNEIGEKGSKKVCEIGRSGLNERGPANPNSGKYYPCRAEVARTLVFVLVVIGIGYEL